jgi:hypothetical protein
MMNFRCTRNHDVTASDQDMKSRLGYRYSYCVACKIVPKEGPLQQFINLIASYCLATRFRERVVVVAMALRLHRVDILLKGSILPSDLGTAGSRALLYCLVSICHPERSRHYLTLLGLAFLGRKVSVSTVRRISATVELLITRSLKRALKVDESVALDTEWAFGITTVGDGCCCDASKSAGKALRVGLAEAEDACAAESGDAQEKDGASELHFEMRRIGIRIRCLKLLLK